MVEQWYQLDERELFPGDVILESGREKASAVVKAFDGKFSHAVLCIGNGQLAEAVSGGVIIFPTARIVTKYPSDFEVWRLPSDLLSRTQIDVITEAPRRWAFSGYDMRGAIATKAPWLAKAGRKHFCSELVAAAYSVAGMELVRGKAASQITPNLLASVYSNLWPVRGEVLKKISTSSPDDLFEIELLADQHKSMANSYIDKNRFIERFVYNKFAQNVGIAARSSSFPGDGLGNLGDIISAISYPDVKEREFLGKKIESELSRLGYFDLGHQHLADIQHTFIMAANERDVAYVMKINGGLKNKIFAAQHWSAQAGRMLAISTPLPIHTRLAVLYSSMANGMEEYCGMVAQVAQHFASQVLSPR